MLVLGVIYLVAWAAIGAYTLYLIVQYRRFARNSDVLAHKQSVDRLEVKAA